MFVNVFDNKHGHLRAPEKNLGRTEEETCLLHFTMCQAAWWALFINISPCPFMKTYEEFHLYISARKKWASFEYLPCLFHRH